MPNMIKCPDCHHEMSAHADFCGYCGRRRMRSRNDAEFTRMIGLLGMLAALFFIGVYYIGGGTAVSQVMRGDFQVFDKFFAQKNPVLEKNQTLVRARLQNGNKAVFRNQFFSTPDLNGTRLNVLCGEVASDATRGAFQKFVASSDINKVSLQQEGKAFIPVWNNLCVKH